MPLDWLTHRSSGLLKPSKVARLSMTLTMCPSAALSRADRLTSVAAFGSMMKCSPVGGPLHLEVSEAPEADPGEETNGLFEDDVVPALDREDAAPVCGGHCRIFA
jgi:hypothetical protein